MILLRNCQVVDVENGEIVLNDILIEHKRIKKLGINLLEENHKVIDLKGAYVCPGFIDIATEIGLVESGRKSEGNDTNEVNEEIIPGMKSLNGIYPFDISFKEALLSGITTVVVSSGGSNVIGAQSSALKTKIATVDDMVIDSSIDIKATLGDEPKKWNQNSQTTPLSRMGIMNLLRNSLIKAKDYMENKTEIKVDINLNYEALARVLNKEIPLKIAANKAQDILSAIEIKKEFNINVIIDECAEGYMVKEYLKEANIPVIVSSPLIDTSGLELINSRIDNVKILMNEGIDVALSTHHPKVSSELLLFSSVMLMREGLSIFDTLKLITVNPAKILNLHDRIGSIKEGKYADLVVFDDLPTNTLSKISLIMIDGEIVFKS
ncbi:amidohydrolase family protein [Clostridium bovifaecis]|uniref:Amidohydrolase family protein n=1 Tax=Clostridium bovifaecis TaxID=2184719 RepID=A0A6I6F750_9CLOT|nr:amidohydrolase family protein [Clostridium bovifaecis]